MCQEATDMSTHQYIVSYDKIGYKMEDHSICFNTEYSYYTTFAYLKENELG